MLHEEVSAFMKVSDAVTACLNSISDIGDEAGRSVLPVDTLHMDICLAFERFQERMSELQGIRHAENRRIRDLREEVK